VELGGQPLIEQSLAILREAGLPASIAGARAALTSFAPVIEDAKPGLGPLSGVCAALEATPAQWAVFLPVDLPLLPASLIVYLLRSAQITGAAVTMASVKGHAQTFPAVVDRGVLPALCAELDAGRLGCFAAFQAAAAHLARSMTIVSSEMLAQCGQVVHPRGLPAALWFANVNSPDDLSPAEALLRRYRVI
jgi:molybdenum cofactor guanylyltransferase